MKKLLNYTIIETVDETNKSIVYRGKSDKDGTSVIIKILKTDYPSRSDVARFYQEYDIIRNINHPGVIKVHDIIDHKHGIALILEDFKGVSLKQMFSIETVTQEAFFEIAIAVSETLGYLHKLKIIHRDIKPHNILVNPRNRQVKLTDFGIAAEVTGENKEIYQKEVIEGTLAYISPEQTGRMNRSVDYHTDFYSLGVTLYQMLTGKLPFETRNPLELIHAHIARKPVPPFHINASTPLILSNIVMKLLAKTAEERYQSGYGISADLRKCWEMMKAGGRVEVFTLGQNDISISLNIPQNLVGREKEISLLLKTFKKVAMGGYEVMMVTGFPGIGKSALINEIHKPIVAQKGYFISGKYEKFRQNVPYSAIIHAFKGLIRQLVSESQERVLYWKNNILDALGDNIRAVTDIIPELALITGEPEAENDASMQQSQQNFFCVFNQFVRVFTKKEHPLVIFMDNLQWMDMASLDVFEQLIKDQNMSYLFLIGAYRDADMLRPFLVANMEKHIETFGIGYQTITLQPLTVDQINQYIAEFLMCAENRSYALAGQIERKTHGNPFFIKQFIKTLYEQKLLNIDPEQGWQWDLEKIEKIRVTENVVDLMAQKIIALKAETQDTLKVCACIGNRFTLETLSIIRGKSVADTLHDLSEAVEEGLIILSDYQYAFQHDRIQEAAYSLIPAAERNHCHYQIGKLRLENIDKQDLDENLFYIVDQLNFGKELVRDREQRHELAGLNLTAGKKAKKSSAYKSARTYLKTAESLIHENIRATNDGLIRSILFERAKVEYLTGHFEAAETIFNDLLEHAASPFDKIKVYNLMVTLNTARGDLDKALQSGIEGLKLVGINISKRPRHHRILMEILQVAWLHRGKKIEDIVNLPPMTDPEKIEAMSLLTYMAIPAYYASPRLFALIIIMGVKLFLKHGISDFTAFGLIGFSVIMGVRPGRYQTGYRYGKVGMAFMEKFDLKPYHAKSYFIFGYFVNHWCRPVKESLHYLLLAYKTGIETGDIMFTCHSINVMTMYRLFAGDHLDDIFNNYDEHMNYLENQKDPFMINNYIDSRQMYSEFKDTGNGIQTQDSVFKNRETMLAEYRKSNNNIGLTFFRLKKLITLFIFNEYRECRVLLEEMGRVDSYLWGTLYEVEYYFYKALTLAMACDTASKDENRRYLKQIKSIAKKMKKWTENCPENFCHKYYLIEAETARITGNSGMAMDFYHKAVASAGMNGFTQNEALANELAAGFYLSKGFEEIAGIYITEACFGYERWGATAKVSQIRKKYSGLVLQLSRLSHVEETSSATSSFIIDISTIRNALKTIAEEKIFSNLVEKTILLAIEFAGAQKGSLILRKDSEKERKESLLVEAEGSVDTDTPMILQSIPVEQSVNLSQMVINYVKRTMGYVVIHNAMEPQETLPQLHSESYIIRHKVKSILCMPIIAMSGVDADPELMGILYLENNRATHTFTEERIETLEIICLSAAGRLELSKQAVTDGLTGLYNHDYFQNMLQQEVRFSLRQGHDLSLIMIDIDHFKNFNDRWGHQVGDIVLASVSKTIRNSCRRSDIVARYGGEEIAVLLRETGAESAMGLAEKIRQAIKKLEISHPQDKSRILSVTISLGVAVFPVHAENKTMLLKKADDALYISKENGRDQVTITQQPGFEKTA